ncbi:hypothetical protein [Rhizobium rhododendri]|uniref:hypothetical protein n=1 Tax=Rhizobium rhododendri TaxID=2506430 RepID=UPI003132FA53
MNDDFSRRLEALCDGKFLCEVFVYLKPDFVFLSKSVGVDDGQKVVVGAITTVVVFDPVTTSVGAKQDQLQDPSSPSFFGKLGLLGVLELLKYDLHDLRQLAAFSVGEMIKLLGEDQKNGLMKFSLDVALMTDRFWDAAGKNASVRISLLEGDHSPVAVMSRGDN